MYRKNILYRFVYSYCIIHYQVSLYKLCYFYLFLSLRSHAHTQFLSVLTHITWYISVFFSFSCISPTLIYIYILKKIHKILYSSFDVNHLPPCPSISVNFADKSSDHSTFFLLKSTNPDSLTGRIASGTISILTVAVFSPSGIPCG